MELTLMGSEILYYFMKKGVSDKLQHKKSTETNTILIIILLLFKPMEIKIKNEFL